MENTVKPELTVVEPAVAENKVKHSIQIEIDKEGQMSIAAFSFSQTDGGTEVKKLMNLQSIRNILREGLDFVADQATASLVAAYIDTMMKQKISPNGFRSTSVGKFLFGK